MAQTINTNLVSLNTQRNLAATAGSLATSIQRLSSGLRVNSAKDDAAGLAIADRMNSQVRGMNVAIRNANDGISLTQTADGALAGVGDMMQRMRELAVQSTNSTNGSDDRGNLNQEFQQLADEVDRVLQGTKFNGKAVLGADATSLSFQVGAGTTTQDSITVSMTRLDTATSITNVTGASSDISTAAAATTAINNIDAALTAINSERSKMGAVQNRFDSVVSNLRISVESQSAARGRIMDADFAIETANLSRAQVLQQAGSAMLSQANQSPNGVLALLR